MSTKPKPSETCPRCYVQGTYIRTRYFDNGSQSETSDVWMCVNPKCRSYRLYWHNDKPNDTKTN